MMRTIEWMLYALDDFERVVGEEEMAKLLQKLFETDEQVSSSQYSGNLGPSGRTDPRRSIHCI